jgi:hypothetical protein
MCNRITSFFVKEGASKEDAAIARELALCYHHVMHSLSYSSFHCNTKLISHIFSDSKVESKLSCGRRKPQALVTNGF